MPNCFQLINRETGKADAFQDIDAAICKDMDWPVDEVRYAFGWYDVIGLGLALGQTFEKMRGYYADDPELLAIINWLDARYTADAWYEHKR